MLPVFRKAASSAPDIGDRVQMLNTS